MLKKFNEEITEIKNMKLELEKDRINALKKLHKISNNSLHLIGEILIQQNNILKKRYQDWKNMNLPEEYNQPKSIYQWVSKHKDKLCFGEKQARRYIQLFEDTENSPHVGEQLGTKKNEMIRRAPKEYRNNLRQKTIENNWSAMKVEKEVQKIKNKELKINKSKTNAPNINIMLDKKNKKRIIIEVDSSYRDAFNEILQQKYIKKIKFEIVA